MAIKKVNLGLDKVDEKHTYHLGHYEVEFRDGSLTFELHARICARKECACDDLQIDWCTGGNVFRTWYRLGEWHDMDFKELDPEMVKVFTIAEKTDTFRERMGHLLYLRRRQVLERADHPEDRDFCLTVPCELLMKNHDALNGILGKIHIKVKGREKYYPYGLEFCEDKTCFCENLFLVIPDRGNDLGFWVGKDDEWWLGEEGSARESLMIRFRTQMMRSRKFKKQLDYFRYQRHLQNYHRYCSDYRKKTAIRS